MDLQKSKAEYQRLEASVMNYIGSDKILIPGGPGISQTEATPGSIAYDIAWSLFHALRPTDRSNDRFENTGYLHVLFVN